jgi:hypothetical protein
MAYVQTNTVFSHPQPLYWTPPVPVQQGIAWGPLLLTLGVAGLVAYASGPFNTPTERRCGTCGRTGHDTRTCSQNSAKRVRLRITKTGWCSCCDRRFPRTEAHHYAGPADGTKGREMCGTCHLVCGHGGDWQNMGTNPRYCRL